MSKLEELRTAIENGKSRMAAPLTQEALDEGATPQEILNVMTDAMDVVGQRFSAGEIFVPEMLIAAKAMSRGMEIINPLLAASGAEKLGLCIIGTVRQDLHDIGKNLVATMIGAAGFDMIDLGVDVPIETFIQAIEEHPDVKIVALSALLTTTMQSLADTVQATISSAG